MKNSLRALLMASVALLAFAACNPRNDPVDLQFLSISDWHGQLDPTSITTPDGGVDVGGAAVLSTSLANERATNPNTFTVTAGDAFGGAPPLSSFFNEEPAVKALNLMGIQADTFGNHNFDRTLEHLQSMIDLASYSFISSNLSNVDANLQRVFSPYRIVELGGVKVGLIGITNPDAPQLIFPGRMGTMTVEDPAPAAMAAMAKARAAGATVFVAITHLGATRVEDGVPSGPLIDFANAVTGFAVIFGDHTDITVNTVINDALVVENRSKGVTYARVALTVLSHTGEVKAHSAEVLTPFKSAVTPDPAVDAMLAPYRAQLASKLDDKLGVANGVFIRTGSEERLHEVPLGDLLADSLRLRYSTQLAIINGGGIRAPLPSSYAPMDKTLRRTTSGYAGGPPYDLVAGDVLAVLPFGNVAVTRSVTGKQVWLMLENGLSVLPGAAGRFPQISGFKFSYRTSNPTGFRVQSVTLDDGTPVSNDAQSSYTLTTNDFMASGGDGYTVLNDGAPTSSRERMADVLLDFIRAAGAITPGGQTRITPVP